MVSTEQHSWSQAPIPFFLLWTFVSFYCSLGLWERLGRSRGHGEPTSASDTGVWPWGHHLAFPGFHNWKMRITTLAPLCEHLRTSLGENQIQKSEVFPDPPRLGREKIQSDGWTCGQKENGSAQTGMMAWPAGSQKWILALTSRNSEFDFLHCRTSSVNQK